MPTPPRITPDRRIPFVGAGFEVIEKRADSSRAVEILRESERNYRLKVLFCGDTAGPPSHASWNRPVSEAGRKEDWNYAECAFGPAGQIRDYGSRKDAVLEILRLATESHVRMADLKDPAGRLR